MDSTTQQQFGRKLITTEHFFFFLFLHLNPLCYVAICSTVLYVVTCILCYSLLALLSSEVVRIDIEKEASFLASSSHCSD